ncbi:MAG: phage terminase small subunit P27 family [Treponema sp.]|jgi:P27 family predicted phage terminase small subunit|nr:phage terminase small subunit P27 family [Treponema sp.]
MGRPRLPSQTKILTGTFHKYRNPENEAKFSPLKSLPAPPRTLNKAGRELWKKAGPELMRSGVMTSADIPAFELLCIRYGMGMELYDSITLRETVDEKTGKVKKVRVSVSSYLAGKNSQTMPEYNAMKNEFQAVRALMSEFGLSPSARNRFGVPSEQGENEREKEMRRILDA